MRRMPISLGGLGDRIEDVPWHSRGCLDPPFAAGAVMLGVAEEMIVEPLEDAAARRPSPSRSRPSWRQWS